MSSRHALFISALVFLLRASAFAASKNDEPPAGIAPTSTTLSAVLTAHERAIGKLAPGVPDTSREHWAFTDMGLSGTEALVRSGTDYRSTVEYGPFEDEYGQISGVRWHKNDNGVVSTTMEEDERSFEMFRVLEDAADPKNDAKVLGRVDAPPATVVEVRRPATKHPEWIFFDERTGLIDRVELVVRSGERLTSDYDDYRTTAGLTQPWHVHDAYQHAYLNDDYRRTSLAIGDGISAKDFARPDGRHVLGTVGGRVTIPSKMVNGTTIVRVLINGRGLDFSVASGSPHTIIDRQVASELGLPTFGQVTEAPDHSRLGYRTVLADAQIGPLHLHNVVAHALTFHYNAGWDTKVVGVLGSDVLAGVVTHLDFVKGAVELIDAPAFDDAVLGESRSVLPVSLVGGVPFFKAKIGATAADHMLFDNDADFTLVFGPFSSSHPDDIKDASGGRHAAYIAPFADANDYGKKVDVWLASPADFIVGTIDLEGLRVVATNAPLEIGGQAVDGILGQDVLCLYDIYLDYSRERVVLVPNQTFYKLFKKKPDPPHS